MEIEKIQNNDNNDINVSNIIKKNNYLCDKYYTKKYETGENWIFTPEIHNKNEGSQRIQYRIDELEYNKQEMMDIVVFE